VKQGERLVDKFDFSAPAELFRRRTPGKGAAFYRRFDTAAAAISYAVEGLRDLDAKMTVLQVEEERLDQQAIRELYDSRDYPLARKS
jgi:hypothetical protein